MSPQRASLSACASRRASSSGLNYESSRHRSLSNEESEGGRQCNVCGGHLVSGHPRGGTCHACGMRVCHRCRSPADDSVRWVCIPCERRNYLRAARSGEWQTLSPSIYSAASDFPRNNSSTMDSRLLKGLRLSPQTSLESSGPHSYRSQWSTSSWGVASHGSFSDAVMSPSPTGQPPLVPGRVGGPPKLRVPRPEKDNVENEGRSEDHRHFDCPKSPSPNSNRSREGWKRQRTIYEDTFVGHPDDQTTMAPSTDWRGVLDGASSSSEENEAVEELRPKPPSPSPLNRRRSISDPPPARRESEPALSSNASNFLRQRFMKWRDSWNPLSNLNKSITSTTTTTEDGTMVSSFDSNQSSSKKDSLTISVQQVSSKKFHSTTDESDASDSSDYDESYQPELSKIETVSGVSYYRRKVLSRVPNVSGKKLENQSSSSGESVDKIPKAWQRYALLRGFPIPGKPIRLFSRKPANLSTDSSATEKSSPLGHSLPPAYSPFSRAPSHSPRDFSRGDSSGSNSGASMSSSRFGFGSTFGSLGSRSESESSTGYESSDANLAVAATTVAASVAFKRHSRRSRLAHRIGATPTSPHHAPLRQSSSPTLGATPVSRHRSLSPLVKGHSTTATSKDGTHLTTPSFNAASSPPRSPLSTHSPHPRVIPSLSLSAEDEDTGHFTVQRGLASKHYGGGTSPVHHKHSRFAQARGHSLQQYHYCDETGHLTAHPEIEIIAPSDEEDGYA